MAAVVPMALDMEKMRKTVSAPAFSPAAASPAPPVKVTPAALTVMPTMNGAWLSLTDLSSTACSARR